MRGTISVKDLAEKLKNHGITIIDARTDDEFCEGHIEGVIHIDVREEGFETALSELDKEQTYAVYCHKGGRGGRTAKLMDEMGFKEVYNVEGGIVAWKEAGLPVVS